MEKKERKPRPMFKACLVANRYRHAQFGELIGLNEQAISGIVTGRRAVSKKEMARIAQALNTPARILFPDDLSN